MPEATLGLFAGASFFLPRLPRLFGEYLGLTGARLDGAEMLACGLATHYVPSAKLSLLEEALTCRVASSTSSSCDFDSTISAIIDEYSLKKSALVKKGAYYKKGIIYKCFSRPTVEEILSDLEEELAKANTRETDGDHNEWLAATIQSLKKALPMSLKIA
ncbi:hypothetical protein C1H46_020733 [Malus baccata]|uniref:3-hydroxyisobutyryl-CoA hydrolase n=1 Tax=Malus baccata TaxID=106549 RepID=A0A540M4F3_MALBA|nr:hypothetical protein C1H46_020733 [Malus baccata]